MKNPPPNTIQPGAVFQITEAHGRNGWIGAFVLATEVKLWGIQGFVHHIDTHEESSKVFIRLPWDHIDYIGEAVMVPGPDPDEQTSTTQRPTKE